MQRLKMREASRAEAGVENQVNRNSRTLERSEDTRGRAENRNRHFIPVSSLRSDAPLNRLSPFRARNPSRAVPALLKIIERILRGRALPVYPRYARMPL